MSKVFSAKRKSVEFEYEFIDGEKVTLNTRSLSSKEQEEFSSFSSYSDKSVINKFKSTLKTQLAKNDEKVVEKVISEQYEEGDIIEFSNSLALLIRDAKEKK